MLKKISMFYCLCLPGLLILFSAGCASVDYSHEAVFPEARADKALVYFYRTPGLIGSTYRFNVHERQSAKLQAAENELIGVMAQNSYFFRFVNAGQYTWFMDDKSTDQVPSITMQVEAGKIYYIKVDIEYRVIGGNPIFTQVNKEEALTLLPSRVYVVPGKNNSENYNVFAE